MNQSPTDTGSDARLQDVPEAGTAPPAEGRPTLTTEVVGVIPVVAEKLEIGRRELHGAVRVRKRVVENRVDVDETRREERVTVERVPVGRPLDGPVGIRHEGDVMVVPVVEERLVVERRLVLVEELHIRRETRTERVPQQVMLRREQVEVERLDPHSREWTAVDVPLRAATSTPGDRSRAAAPEAGRETAASPQDAITHEAGGNPPT